MSRKTTPAAALWPRPAAGIHPSAVVDPSAQIDPTATVGPLCVIEANVVVGPRTVLQAQAFLGRAAHIGADGWFMPGVHLATETHVGDRVKLHAGVVLGSDGFGYDSSSGKHLKIPQVGQVVIADDVEIGANTTIDRARFGRTWIGEGTKIDNLDMIAHNCVIGRHVIIVAQAGIAGSTRIADYTVVAAQVGIAGHLDIGGPGVTFTAKTGVTANIRTPGVYMGTPAQPMKEYQHQLVMLRRLPDLAARVKRLEHDK